MSLAIVGTGRMGRALAGAAVRAGRPPVLVPGRADPVHATRLLDGCPLVVLALPLPAVLDFLRGPAGSRGRGRTLIDPSNPPAGGHVADCRSGGELVAEAAGSRWRVVKAFNTVSAAALAEGPPDGSPVSLPVATDDAAAREDTFELARDLGFEPLDAGGIRASRELEALATLLMTISKRHGLHGHVSIRIGSGQSLCQAG